MRIRRCFDKEASLSNWFQLSVCIALLAVQLECSVGFFSLAFFPAVVTILLDSRRFFPSVYKCLRHLRVVLKTNTFTGDE